MLRNLIRGKLYLLEMVSMMHQYLRELILAWQWAAWGLMLQLKQLI